MDSLFNTDAQDSALSLLEHIDDMVSIVDNTYHYRAVSQGYTHFFGIKASDIVGKHVSEIHGIDIFKEKLKEALDKTLAGEEFYFQFSRPNSEGDIRHLDSRHTPYTGPLTTGKGVAIVARDITELKLVQDKLEQERRLLSDIINSIPDMLFLKDPQRRYKLCNNSFAEFMGMTPDQIIGRTDNELMSQTSAEYIEKRDSEVLNEAHPIHKDEWVTYNDGRQRLLDMHKLPLNGPDNKLMGLLGIGRNVTHEREAEQQLLMSSLVFETTRDPCLILAHDGRVISINQAAKNTLHIDGKDNSHIYFNDLFSLPDSTDSKPDIFINGQDSWLGEINTSDNRTLLSSINAIRETRHELNRYVVVIRDPESQTELTQELINKAYHDALTKLPNRLLFLSRLSSAISRSERQLRKVALLFIDLNRFKPINDKFGHRTGDHLLQLISHRLRECFRSTDTIARIGGDEFAALIDLDSTDDATAVAKKISSQLNTPFKVKDIDVQIGASIGISIFPDDANNASELLERADQAMYQAKNNTERDYASYRDIPKAK